MKGKKLKKVKNYRFVTLKHLVILMMIILILFVVCQGQQYQPNFPRMFYTPERESMIIKFDTFASSPQAYVTIEQGNNISKYNCTEKLLSITQDSTFNIYIHRC